MFVDELFMNNCKNNPEFPSLCYEQSLDVEFLFFKVLHFFLDLKKLEKNKKLCMVDLEPQKCITSEAFFFKKSIKYFGQILT